MKTFKKIALAFVFILTLCTSSLFFVSCNEEKPLSLASTFKTTYYVGEELDVTGGILRYIDEDGDSLNIELKSTMVSIFSTDKPGKRKLMITYQNESILVDYTVKPWDVQDHAYYVTSQEMPDQDPIKLYTFLTFDKSAGTVTMFNTTENTPYHDEDNEKTYDLTKSIDEDGYIVYTFNLLVEQGPTTQNMTYTISNIDKTSFKLGLPGVPSTTFTIYNITQ